MDEVVPEWSGLISISVVSHGQLGLIASLLEDIQRLCVDQKIELILTLNLDEYIDFQSLNYFFPIQVIKNATPKGFGANHNQAFRQARGQFFCVINPDIRFDNNPFPELLNCFASDKNGVVAPLVIAPTGELEDSVRVFPSPGIIFKKVLGQPRISDYSLAQSTIQPDWVGGMFMLFPRAVFKQLKGFDEAYFLYYEDVDLCGRLQLAGFRVAVCTSSRVIHQAQRSSHRNLKYLRWHIQSMLRFFCSSVYRQLKSRTAV